MAAPSGQPQGVAPVKTKKEFTPEQKRTFGMLGFAGFLFLVAAIMYLPGLLGGGSSTPETAQVATTGAVTPTDGAIPPGEGAPGPDGIPTDGIAAPAAPAAATASYAPVSRFRGDPFTPFIVNPLPLTDSRVVAPPIEVPVPDEIAPVFIDSPNGVQGQDLPRLNLPAVVIPRMATQVKAPRDVLPPPRTTGGGTGGEPQPSYDKRLSGVVIANGVRALLEVTSGGELKSYVVQPGDTVEGVTVLNIQRFSEGTSTTTRMLVRENGQERYVDLKAAPQRAIAGPEGAAPGGFPGGP